MAEMVEETRFDRLKAIRNELNLLQKEFAASLDLSPSAYSDLEKGRYGLSVDILEKLSLKYNVNLHYLLFGKGSMFESNIDNIERFKVLMEKDMDIRRFLEYFVESSIVRYRMLSDFQVFLLEKKIQINSQVKGDEGQE